MAMRRAMSIVEMKGGLFRQNRSDIVDILGAKIEFVEGTHGSVLKAECNGDRFKGFYQPPEAIRDVPSESGRLSHRYKPLSGMAVVEGHVELIDGCVSIRGTWKHVDSAFSANHDDCVSGPFSMKSVSAKSADEFTGSWRFETSVTLLDWKWTRNKSRDLATRLVESAWMDRYGMLCSWLFLFQTFIQLMSLACDWDSNVNEDINQAFNAVYAVCYICFLFAFGLSSVPREFLYMAGITCYSFGYIVFVGIYSGTRGQETLYHVGSWLFLVGSILLMGSATPKGRGYLHAYSPHRIQSSIWWGSTMFLLGSISFACDASGYGVPWTNGVLGLSCFTAGRCFFVRGSQTSRCTFVFFSVETLEKLYGFGGITNASDPEAGILGATPVLPGETKAFPQWHMQDSPPSSTSPTSLSTVRLDSYSPTSSEDYWNESHVRTSPSVVSTHCAKDNTTRPTILCMKLDDS